MNNSYVEDKYIDSKRGIYESYFTECEKPCGQVSDVLSGARSLIRFLTGIKARRMFKAGTVAVCLLSLIGVIGAMESGALPLFAGLCISAVLLGAEYLCLRRKHRSC